MSRKRVTVTVELVDSATGSTAWSHTETAEHSTGDNPLHHWADVAAAMTTATGHALRAVMARFGDYREAGRGSALGAARPTNSPRAAAPTEPVVAP